MFGFTLSMFGHTVYAYGRLWFRYRHINVLVLFQSFYRSSRYPVVGCLVFVFQSLRNYDLLSLRICTSAFLCRTHSFVFFGLFYLHRVSLCVQSVHMDKLGTDQNVFFFGTSQKGRQFEHYKYYLCYKTDRPSLLWLNC